MKRIIALALVVVATTIPVFSQGCFTQVQPIKPIAPIGCGNMVSQCLCAQDGGNCRWTWVCSQGAGAPYAQIPLGGTQPPQQNAYQAFAEGQRNAAELRLQQERLRILQEERRRLQDQAPQSQPPSSAYAPTQPGSALVPSADQDEILRGLPPLAIDVRVDAPILVGISEYDLKLAVESQLRRSGVKMAAKRDIFVPRLNVIVTAPTSEVGGIRIFTVTVYVSRYINGEFLHSRNNSNHGVIISDGSILVPTGKVVEASIDEFVNGLLMIIGAKH